MQMGVAPPGTYVFSQTEMLNFQRSQDFFVAYWDGADELWEWREQDSAGKRAPIYQRYVLPLPANTRLFPSMYHPHRLAI